MGHNLPQRVLVVCHRLQQRFGCSAGWGGGPCSSGTLTFSSARAGVSKLQPRGQIELPAHFSKQFSWHTARLLYSHAISGCFCATNLWSPKPKIVTIWSFIE